MKTRRLLSAALFVVALSLPSPSRAAEAAPDDGAVIEASEVPFTPDAAYLADRAALDKLQHDAFLYMWEMSDPSSGMAVEANYDWEVRPVATGGSGFGIAAIVVATERGWITREAAVARMLAIARFLRDKTPRQTLYGAFPHWMNGTTGETVRFGDRDSGADIVETALLMQGLLIARAYFNGPGSEAELRSIITGLWEDIDWNWFTAGQESGLFWHWTPEHGHSGLKILGNNECLIAYILALASPTHPISRTVYDYWSSGDGYKPKDLYGYTVEAALPGAGPLFLAHYSFIGLDPRRMADSFVPGGYFARNVKHVLSNRGYCLFHAPARNRYSEGYWGLSASHVKGGYAAGEPSKDPGAAPPTAALASMPYTPHYSMQVLDFILEGVNAPDAAIKKGSEEALRKGVWGPYGPFDAYSLRDKWVSPDYLAIDQLPIVGMVENYRSGLLWNLFMSDPDIKKALDSAGIHEPDFAPGFPEAVVTMKRSGKKYVPDAFDIRRHPDDGLYTVPYWVAATAPVTLALTDSEGTVLLSRERDATKGRNHFSFAPFIPLDALNGAVLTLTLTTPDGAAHTLPIRLH